MPVVSKTWVWGIGSIVALIVLCIAFSFTFVNVKPGYVGVMYDRTYVQHGGVVEQPYTGFVWINPFTQRMSEYPIAMRTVYLTLGTNEGSGTDDSINIPTLEGQPLNVDLNFSYNINAQKAPDLYYAFRGQDITSIEQSFIRSNVESLLRNTSGNYSILGIYGDQRTIVTEKAMQACSAFFAPYGINMISLNFGDVRLPGPIATSVGQKIQAAQDAQTAQAHLAQAQVDAETAKVTAEGQANAILALADAQAKANLELAASLLGNGGALVNQKAAIDKWDGHYPTIMGGSNMMPIIQVPGAAAAVAPQN